MDPLTNFLTEVALGQRPSKPPQPEEITTESLQKELVQEQKNAKLAARQKGQPFRNRYTRDELIDSHKQDLALSNKRLSNEYVRAFKTVVSYEYKPSLKGLDTLTPITFKDLLVGIVHRNNYVVLR